MAFPKIVEGPPVRPVIKQDHGFLDDGKGNIDPSKYRSPTLSNRASWAVWHAKGEAATYDPWLVDAGYAYLHFLDGSGTDYTVRYNKFLTDDDSGKTVLSSTVEDIRAAAISIDDAKIAASPVTALRQDNFPLISDPIGVGRGTRYPYPDTENWQKTIGAHYIWLEATVSVQVDPTAKKRTFTVNLTIHMEDEYNFNPGAKDIATGIPDSANGIFEVTRLGKEFLSVGTAKRTITFTEPITPVPDPRAAPADQNVVTPGRR